MSDVQVLDMTDLIELVEDPEVEVVQGVSEYPPLYLPPSNVVHKLFDTAPPPPNYAVLVHLSKGK
jgi:hypothetical protein